MIQLRVKILLFKLQLLVLMVLSVAASAQSQAGNKKIFAKAESYFLYEEYELANQLYILLDSPDNLNVRFKIGTCYLNIPGEKQKAIPYLEDAVRDATYAAKIASFKEKRAPLDAYFFLAKSYMINNELEKALNILMKFRKLALETEEKGGMKNTGYIDQQIQACQLAIEYDKAPVAFSRQNLGPEFNQGAINENPAVSFDGSTIAFTERRGLMNAIFYSKKEEDGWRPPVEFSPWISAGTDCSSSALNKDGTVLFIYKVDNYDGNIYSSEYVNGEWTPIKKLNSNINTKYYESHASISADEKKLYFTSNRPGGNGGLDIYVSEIDATGDWGPAINLGTAINTIYNDNTPFITLDDSVLYFSSEGHNSMGGYDFFKSERSGSTWEKPANLGSPINTTDDDIFFQPFNNGMNGYYSMTTGYKKKEIFYLDFGSSEQSQKYEKVDLSNIPPVAGVDSSILLENLVASDLTDNSINDSDILYYTVQVMALYNPADISYFKFVSDIKVIYNETDLFYRYTSGIFDSKEEAYSHWLELINKGYEEDLFVKKVSRIPGDKPVTSRKYFTIQLKCTKTPLNINNEFPKFKGIRETKEIDGLYHYLFGRYETYSEAKTILNNITKEDGFKDAFVREINVMVNK